MYTEVSEAMYGTERMANKEYTEHECSLVMRDYLKLAKFRIISKRWNRFYE